MLLQRPPAEEENAENQTLFVGVTRLEYIEAGPALQHGENRIPSPNENHWSRLTIETIASGYDIYIRYDTQAQEFKFDVEVEN